ncbi:toll-like receptor 4 [Physella acuta]|uniref:toll-like receptor 4 n=1 Tax=Physella acuta TaxID=109671 RepID=UPI0027DCEBF2|nr:toll-like receptor 4 [Physella acuta]
MFSNLVTATIFLGSFIFAITSKWFWFSKTPTVCFIVLMSSVISGACTTLLEEHAQASDLIHGDSLFSKNPRKFASKTDLTNSYSDYKSYKSRSLKGYNEFYKIKDIFLCEPCVCCRISFSLTSATCQSNGDLNMSTIPDSLPRNINTLFVKLSDITAFNAPEILPYLNITWNQLLFLENSTFNHMKTLEVLDLSQNPRLGCMSKHFPLGVFSSLQNLNTIFIEGNAQNGDEYPNMVLQQLKNLKIKIKGCSATSMNMTMFLALTSLRSLSILNMPHYDLYDALEDLQGIVKSSMIELQLSKLTSTFMCRILDETHAKYLQHMRLKHLDLSDNSIVMMTNIATEFATGYQEETSLAGHDIDPDDDLHVANHGCPVTQSHYPYSRNGMVDSNSKDRDEKEISIPERLQILLAPQYLHFGLYILFCKIDEKSNLHQLDFYSSFISHWGTGELPKKVKYANFANNYCRNLTKHFFSKNNELEILLLRNNVLGDVFATDSHGEIFSNLGKLQHINLSKNSIYKIPREFFRGLKSVEIIILSQNNIQVLNVSFASTMNLKFINLSRNSIFAITKNTLHDLDNIAVQHTIFVDLTMNPLPCTCPGLPMIFWLASTNVYLLSKDLLTCVDEENNVIKIGSLERRLKSLQRHCASKELTPIVSLFSGVCIALIVSLLTLYRFRWRLRYLRTVAIVKLFGFEPKLPKNPRYKYDAYIIYTDETRNFAQQDCVHELEVKRGHRLCIEERDFMPGTYTVSAIVSAVQNSAKTVPVVTPEFYDGEYAEYSLKMAVMEEIFSKRSVLHLCIYQPVSADDMTRDLLAAMKKNHFTEFPADDHLAAEARLIFWNDMSSAIGRNPRED